MNKNKRFLIVAASMVAILLIVSNFVVPAQADKDAVPTPIVSGTPYSQMDEFLAEIKRVFEFSLKDSTNT